jgi:hypothetical protein
LVTSKAYTSIQEFVEDFESACGQLILNAKPSSEGSQWKYVPGDLEQDKLLATLIALRKSLASLVRRDAALRSKTATTALSTIMKAEGIKEDEEDQQTSSRTVLTLFGNAQGHKQLFSSFQQPLQDDATGAVQPILSLRENGLPNGILSTQLVALQQDDATAGTKKNTFLDTFPPTNTLPQLPPPRTSRQIHNDSSSTIVWGSAREHRPERTLGYAYQKLTTGQWLGYNRVAGTEHRSNMDESVTAPALGPPEEDALFRSVYSTFAPSRDNTGAVFSDQVKDELWWHKVGQQAFEQSLGASPYEEEATKTSSNDEDEAKKFADAAENFDPALLDLPKQSKTDDRDMLEEISELLESLYSYQRIRNLSVKGAVSGSANVPPSPTEAEVETYNTLKAQLSLVIATLPPYAVSKLNGDQLEELNISVKIPIEEKNIRGVLEEDAQSRAAKAATLSAAIGAAAASNRAAGLSTPAASTRTAPMTTGRAGQQYGAGAGLIRQTSQANNRQPLSGWQTPGATQSSTAPRQSYMNQSAYGSQSARPAYNNNSRLGTGQFGSTANRQNTPLPTKNTQPNYGSRLGGTNYNSYTANGQQAPMTTFNSPQATNQGSQYQPRASYLSQAAQSASPGPATSRGQTPAGMTTIGAPVPKMGAMRSISGTPQPQGQL